MGLKRNTLAPPRKNEEHFKLLCTFLGYYLNSGAHYSISYMLIDVYYQMCAYVVLRTCLAGILFVHASLRLMLYASKFFHIFGIRLSTNLIISCASFTLLCSSGIWGGEAP